MNKFVLGLFSISATFMAGCALEAGDDGEDSVSSVDQALKAVIFKGGGNTGFSNETDKTATITADKLQNASAKGGIGISIKVDDAAPFEAGSIRTADCAKRTVSVTYKQADIQRFTATTPPGIVRFGRCIASVSLEWSRNNAPGTARFLAPSPAAAQQRVVLSAMPVTPAVGNITVVTKTNGVANTDKYNFRVDPAQ
jgi:hypothetical protein